MHTRAKLAYSKREAAHLIGVSERLVDQLISANKIASVRIGRRVLIPRDALIRFLNNARQR